MNVLYLIEIVIYLYSFNFLLDIRMLPYVSNFYLFCYLNRDLYVTKKKSMSNQQVYPFGYTISVWSYVVLKLIRIEYKNK